MAEQPALGFGALLRQLRAEARLTQEELAGTAGLSPRSISDLERGINRTARKDTAELLAGALGLAEPVRPVFIAAARGRIPAADVLAARDGDATAEGPAPGPDSARTCPYRGLLPFEERDARLFYGRDELAGQLVRRLAEHRDGILLVTGESGTGKSSLLQAGLLPRLASGALGPGSELWPRRVIRPAGNPLRELAMHLAELAGADPLSVYRSLSASPDEAPMLAEQAARIATGRGADPGPGGRAGAVAGPPPRLILVVDQFEEVFTAAEGGDAAAQERRAFIRALHAAATIPAGSQGLPPALVVVAVRADYLGRLIAHPPLKAALNAGLFTVGPMSEAELRLAVTGPAAEAGLDVEPAVVEAVVDELRDEAGGGLGRGVLPLMSQAMAATWERREGSQLTLRGYRRTGGVADAVNRGAQAAYDALTGAQQDAARLVFTQLTVITIDGQFARRRCRRADLTSQGSRLAADANAVIGVFATQRLLVLGQDSVEIAHDVLLQAWKQLRDWLGDDQLDRALYSQVISDAATWDGHGRDPAYLYRPGRLATVDVAAARWQGAPARYFPLPATASAFLGAGHHAARRATQLRRGVLAGLLVLTVTALSAAGFAVRDSASASRQHAIALSRQLAADSLAAGSASPLTARRLAVAAWRVLPTDQAGSAMASLLIEQQRGILPGDPANGGVIAVAFSPDDHRLAAAYGDGYVRLWDPATGQAIGAAFPAAAGPGGYVFAVAFSPDGKWLATGDTHGYLRLWNPATRQAIGPPIPADTGPNRCVNALAFSPDGKLLATAGTDGYVRLWDPSTRRAVLTPMRASTSPAGNASAVAFSPDGKLLASADAAGYVRLWNPATQRATGAPFLTVPNGGVNGLAFSPDSRILATADDDDTVRLWNPATRQAAGPPFPAGRGSVNAVAFGPDGKLLATASSSGQAQLWNLATRQPAGAPLPASGPGQGLNGVAFSPDGTLLAGADADGSVRLWDPATRQARPSPGPAAGGVNGVAFSPDGKLLASADGDGNVRTRDPATQQLTRVLAAETGPGSRVTGVAFSPDGKLLASADGDDTVRLWNPATGQDSGGFAGQDVVAFSPDGKLLAAPEPDGTVRTWDLASRRAAGAPLAAAPAGRVTGMAFSPDGRLLATAGTDGYVRLWDLVTRRPSGAPLPAGTGPAGGVAFSPDGKLLASAGGDGAVRLWDTVTRQPLGAPLTAASSGRVNQVAFSPDGKLLAAAYGDGYARLWKTATGQPFGVPLPASAGPGGSVTGVTFSPDGGVLATSDTDGTVRMWPLPLFTDPYTALCAEVGPPTQADWARYAPGEPQPHVCQ